VLPKLFAELSSALPSPPPSVPDFTSIQHLPYLRATINETLRVHCTSSLGLPRVVPPGPGVTILDHHFAAGTVLSVPSYTVHHDQSIWGEDADEFKPERWLGGLTERQKQAFIPFSTGPRACVGRNVAEMELCLILATVVLRYEFVLYEGELQTREGFLRKPLGCKVGLKRRVEVKG
jgi:benzoate 4-monooxygenase